MEIKDALFVYHLVEDNRIAWHGRYHAHGVNEYEAHFFLEGSGTFLRDRTKYAISPDRLFLTAPHEFHSIIPNPQGKPISYYAVLFTLEDSPDTRKLLNRERALTIDRKSRFYFDDIVRLNGSGDGILKKAGEYLLQSLALRFFCGGGKDGEGSPGESRESPGKTPKRCVHVEKALNIMRKEVRNNLRIEDIAAQLSLSGEHFARLFHREVSLSPHQYFLQLKVQDASGLLISTAKTVGQIADYFGFENQFHFSRVFKKCTGLSPLRYRQAYLQMADFVPRDLPPEGPGP